MINSQWTSWWQNDIPCQFSQKQTEENKQYLIKIFSESWLKKRIHGKKGNGNPLVQRWINNGVNSYLELNSLAEDIRLLGKKPCFETILKDLKSTNTCMATWHVIHSAALFERAEKGVITRFYNQTSSSAPDFSLTIGGSEYPVEAKLLTQSECEIEFEVYSRKLIEQISSLLLVQNLIYPQIMIVIKCFESLPDYNDIINSLKQGLHNYKGKSMKGSFNKYNVFIDSPVVSKKDFTYHKTIYIFSPRSDKENIRMEGRVKDASKQLKKHDSELSGFVFLGIGEHQDPYYAKNRLLQRFQNRQLKAVSSVVLLRSGTYLQKPKRTIIDLISIISNKNATKKVSTSKLIFRPIGLCDKLIQDNHITNKVSSYRTMIVEGKIAHTDVSLIMPDIKYLTTEMLQ